MLFNSFQFFAFLLVVYGIYLAVNHRWQNRLLILASCLFYSAWSWKFLILMFVSITTDFYCSKHIDRSDDPRRRKLLLFISIFVNLGILAVFKYYNFFISNFEALIPPSLYSKIAIEIILPVGVSFYTFEAISYVVDVYRKTIKPARHYSDYLLFVIYFPHLVAGPIMRAKQFLPQITAPRVLKLQEFYAGCYLICWGLFEKVFVADNLSKLADPIFSASSYDGGKVLLAIYAFAFQIFCDFDGYSNMARGMGKCMGFDITINFQWPYFATNPSEFWKRWHISLSSWLRDYLYIPLGGNRGVWWQTLRNLFITMLLGGLWHGASWTFVIWGAYQGGLLVLHKVLSPFVAGFWDNLSGAAKWLWKGARIIVFFHLVCLGWLFFRAQSLTQAGDMLRALAFNWDASQLAAYGAMGGQLLLYSFMVITVHIFQYRSNDHLVVLKWPFAARLAFYVVCYFLLVFYGVEGGKEFIYFQF